jgi:Flp pilus assembly protein CpaB
MASASLPFESARVLQRSRRLHRGWYVGVVLLITSAVGGYSVYQSRPVVEHSVLIAARDVAPGTVLSRDDLGTRSVVVDDAWLASLVPATELSSLVGRVAPEPLHAGMPVERAQVAPRDFSALALAIGPIRVSESTSSSQSD